MNALLEILAWNALEASLLALAVAIVVRYLRLSAPVRHALWLIVLLRLLVPPIGFHSYGLGACCSTVVQSLHTIVRDHSSVLASSHWGQRDSSSSPNPLPVGSETVLVDDGQGHASFLPEPWVASTDLGTDAPVPIGSTEPDDALPIEADRASQAGPIRESVGVASGWVPRSSSFRFGLWARCERLIGGLQIGQIVFLGWLTGAWCLLILRIKQCWVMTQVVRSGAAASSQMLAVCRETAERLGVRRLPSIRIVPDAVSPTVFALGRAKLVLPARLLDECDWEMVRTVLAHELAHIRRRDHWVCWVELIGSFAYWWNPVFWLVQRQIRRAADEAADGCAVLAVGGRQRYAELLLQTVEILVADRSGAAAWGPALGERDTIARRLTMIMKGPLRNRLGWPSWLAIVVVGLLVLSAAPRALIAQDAGSTAQPPGLPPAAPPSDEEFRAVVELLNEAGPGIEPQGDRRPREPRPPVPPGRGERPGTPVPPHPPERPDGRDRRDPERRLGELEQKVDQILQLLQAMHGGRPGAGAGMGGGMMMGGPGGAGRAGPPFGGGLGRSVAGEGSGDAQPPGGAGIGGWAGGGMAGMRRPAATPPEGRPAGQPPGESVERRPRQADPFRGVDLNQEQRERMEVMQREFEAEMQRIEADQARMMAELTKRRVELEKRMNDMRRELLTPDQRERMERRDGDRGRDGPDSRFDRGSDRPRGGADRGREGERRGSDRPREGGADRRPDQPGDSPNRDE